MTARQRGVILYGYEVDAVARALRDLDSRYVLVDRVAPESGQVPIRRYPHGAAADAARERASGVAWLVVELYRPGLDVQRARDPLLALNTAEVGPELAARAIDQPDLVIWYEVINAVQVVTVDDAAVADDYGNVAIIVPDGHRTVAHAVRRGGSAPECVSAGAERVLPSDDLWALAQLWNTEVCQFCALRHRPG